MDFIFTVFTNILSNILTSFVWAIIIVGAIYFFISKLNDTYKKTREELLRTIDEVRVIIKKNIDEFIKFFKQLAMSVVRKIMVQNKNVRRVQCSVKFSLEFKQMDSGWENIIQKDDISEDWIEVNQ